ncbi:hypothetical protein ASC61_08500 [Aeromicrobium sp. Root344]|nr:hypothetical protein ASC61_08500 [Aeromicrobium sp. Root344]
MEGMTEDRPERPHRLVSTCLYLGFIGVFQAVQALRALTGWDSIEGQERVARFTDPWVEDGLTRGHAELIYRIYLGVLAFLGAAVLVFAIYSAMGHAVSRIMLTIATPIMATVGILQSIPAFLVGFLALFLVFQLWHPDVRRWFDLMNGKEPPPARPAAWPPPLPSTPHADPAGGAGPGAPQHWPGPPPWAPHPQAYAPRPPAPTDPVKVVSIIALIISSIVAAGCAFFLVVYGFAREELVQQQVDSDMNWMNLSEAEIRDSYHDLAVLSWVVLPLCLVAIVVSAVLLVRRRRRD